jgi:hypothetical protein
METAVSAPDKEIQFPNFGTPALILREACAAWNMRHAPAEWLNPETSPWDEKFLGGVYAFLRHSCSGYDQMLDNGADRDTLRSQIHAAARRTYPWLNLDSDPRMRFTPRSRESTRHLDSISRVMSEALQAKQEALAQSDRTQARKLDQYIASGLDYCQWARSMASPGFVDEALQNGFRMSYSRRVPGEYCYVFEDRGELPENLTVYLPARCQRCLARVRRTKREIDLGGGARLYAVSCLCTSTLLPRSLRHVPQGMWDSITKKN